VLQFDLVWCRSLQCVAVVKTQRISYFSVTQFDEIHCTLLLCVAMCCSSKDPGDALSLCVAVRYSALQCDAVCCSSEKTEEAFSWRRTVRCHVSSVLHCAPACCSVMQCVAVVKTQMKTYLGVM